MVTLQKQNCMYYGYKFLQQICTVTHLSIHIQNLSLFIVAMTHILYCLTSNVRITDLATVY
jgi:hypothetical protein